MSIFAKIASDPGMKAQLRAAKEKPPEERRDRPQDFEGPDGNYVAKFIGQRLHEKDGNQLCFFEYGLVGGEYDGQRISRLFWFSGTEPSDITMDNLVATCRTMGIDTSKDMDAQLDKVVRAETQFDVGIVTDKKNPKYRTVYVNRVHEASGTDDKDEWSGDKEEPATEARSEPSLKGSKVTCGGDECLVLSHDMETNLLVLVNPDDTEEVWYTDATVDDVVPF